MLNLVKMKNVPLSIPIKKMIRNGFYTAPI